jgi:diguanylate cyclase (GGDEF)-like protein/PAS domain S-box-containing protein
VQDRGELYAALVEDAYEIIVVLRPDLTIAYVNDALTDLLGHRPEDVIDRSVADYVHVDDLERALFDLAAWEEQGIAPRGADTHRLRHADGSWPSFGISVAAVSHQGEPCLAVYCRPADHPKALESVLAGLLTGMDRAETFTPLVDVFDWRVNDSHIAIAWYEPDRGHRFTSTGLPRELTGAEAEPGGPWDRARRHLQAVRDDELALLDPARRALAHECGRGSLWIEPVPDVGSGVPALITVWTRADGLPAQLHAYGMALARNYVELILRWSHQASSLDAAAHTDVLTGLPNRRSLFDLLDRERQGGALLFCDLDRFKPVNDEFGHAVGDEVLRQVATRLRASVRADDVVARTGGDEFVVLAHGATDAEADDLAVRIIEALDAPFAVAGTEIELGISVGIARADGPLDDEALARADRAMLADKARHRHRHPSYLRL